jgi:hypothetical protein
MPPVWLKFLLSAFILLTGCACAWRYWRMPERCGGSSPLRGHRPWRRVGAGICLVLAIMFVAGANLVDIPDHPRMYGAFWIVMLLLLLWLCGLALKDIHYTRRLLHEWRDRRGTTERFGPPHPSTSEDTYQ